MESLLTYFEAMRWQDVLDILLNSYILFRLYILFRGTNVIRVLIGIAFLWFFQRMAVFFGLILASSAIQGIMAAVAILIIVIFRDEIRSVLQAKNLRSLLWGFNHKGIQTPTDVIVEAVFEMSQRRMGALLVFPRKTDLRPFIHSELPWQGLVSKEMLLSIFWHDNPVHDGAAIIQGDQITHVGAILPLSRRKDLPAHFGTRHRAAVEFAEKTDALVVVVSEETGKVTVARGSRIERVGREEELAWMLREHGGFSEKLKGPLKRRKFELGMASLLSLLFVSGVWVSFTRGLDTLMTIEVPIEYMNRESSMEILETSVNVVLIHLSGSANLIRSLQPGQVQVRLDLSNAVSGPNTYTVTQDNITIPPTVKIIKVEPQTVEVVMDVETKKEMYVQADWVGKLDENLILVQATILPDKVKVGGGSLILESLDTIYTEKIPLESIKASGNMTVKLTPDPPSLQITPDSKDKVTVSYVVKERPREEQE